MDNEERFALAARITELERELERVRACNRQGDALVALLQSQLAARRTVSGQLKQGDMREIDGKIWTCTDPDIDRWVSCGHCTVSGQEAEPVCWITREQLTRVEDEGEDAWVYWAETGHVAEPDEVALYAAPIPATEQDADRYRFLRDEMPADEVEMLGWHCSAENWDAEVDAAILAAAKEKP